MSITRSKKILELFYELGEKMDVKIVNAKGDFQGGYCQVNDKRHIVINKIKPLDDNIIVYPGHGAGSACGKRMMKERGDEFDVRFF